jgi:hypothetical protein
MQSALGHSVQSHRPRLALLQATTAVAAFWTVPGLFAEQLLTPAMTEGPFYPDKLRLDTDNDQDGVLKSVRDPQLHKTILIDFKSRPA